ncbi:MAG: hypothetical protein ACAI34_10655 [Verrucomicrobium sp.]
MKFAPVVILSLGLLSTQQTMRGGEVHDGIAKLQQLMLADFKAQDAWFPEVLDKVRAVWFATYPDQSFPVICLEPEERMAAQSFSFDVQNMPAYQLIDLARGANVMNLSTRLDMVRLRTVFELDGDGPYFVSFKVPAEVCQRLGIPTGASKDRSTDKATKQRLETLGLNFEEGTAVEWLIENTIKIRNTPYELEKFFELIRFAEEGYVVKKLP